MQPTREVRQLTRQFGIRVQRMKPVHKGVYKVTSNRKHYCLKKMRYPAQQIRWIDQMIRQMRERGFKRLAWRYTNRPEGRKLFARKTPGSIPYLLTPWIDGRWPSPASSSDMKASAIALARFHEVGRKLVPPRAGRQDMIGKWPALFQSQHNLIQRQINKAKRNGHRRELNTFLKIHGDEILRRSSKAWEILRESDYKIACADARRNGSVCHGDGGPTNFLLNRDGTYLIDFETLRLDLRAYDLYRVIHNSCKDYNWNFRIAQSIIEGYQTVSKLDDVDFDLLEVWLRFPHRIYRLLNVYIRSKNTKSELFKAIKEDRKKERFLEQLAQYRRKERSR